MTEAEAARPPETQLLAEELVLELPAVEEVLGNAVCAAAATAERSCGITYRTRYGLVSVASSDVRAGAVDEIQYTAGDGPCLQAMRTGEPVRVDDVATETRWGDYPQLALDAGIRSSLSYPLVVHDASVGALNVYSVDPGPWSADDEAEILLLSLQVAAIIQSVQEIAADLVRDPHEARALSERRDLDVAVGIVMAQRNCSEIAGREWIRNAAARRGLSVPAVVHELLVQARDAADAANPDLR